MFLILTKIFRRKDGSLDRIIEIKTTLVQMRRVGELKSIFGFVILPNMYRSKVHRFSHLYLHVNF